MIDQNTYTETDFIVAKGLVFIGDKIITYRRDHKTDESPGLIDLPGGLREGNESPFETFKREVQEEFGIDIFPDDIEFSFTVPSRKEPDKKVCFFVTKPLKINSSDIILGSEGTEWMLMSTEEFVSRPDIMEAQKQRVQKYLDMIEMNKKVIIWDFDGVIVDSRKLALEYTQFQFEDITEDAHRELFGANIFEATGKLKRKNVTEEQVQAFLDNSYWPRKVELVPVEGMKEIVESLCDKYTMVINSSSSTPQIERYLEKHNIIKCFQKVYGREVSSSKIEKFHLIFKDLNVSAKDCILITDTLGDVLEAQMVNIPSLVVLWGYQEERHFESIKDKIDFIKDPTELVQIIETKLSS